MAKMLREHVKYTVKELDQYTESEGSCVKKVNTNMHLSIGPFCLTDFKHILRAHILRRKVGSYDVHLDGIILDVKKVKVLGTAGAMRADDPRIHVNVNADVYLFQPTEGAELIGVVKHIGAHHVGVVLYRVFSVNLRVCEKVDREMVQMDQNVKFRIRNFNLQNIFPYIDGELLNVNVQAVSPKAQKVVFNDTDNVDSGIEVKDGGREFDELLSLIKIEESDESKRGESSKKSSKRTKKQSGNSESIGTDKPVKKTKKSDKILSAYKSEIPDDFEIASKTKKSTKRSKKSSEAIIANEPTHQDKLLIEQNTIDWGNSSPPLTPKKIKSEPFNHSGSERTPDSVTNINRDKSCRTKTKNSPVKHVQIKQESYLDDD